MDARRQKAHELADRARITFADGCWHVPSQSGAGQYTVLVDDQEALCDCPDFELRDKPCKHIMAVRLFIRRQERGIEQAENTAPAPKVKRPTYPQDWPNYNAAQVNERRHFLELLADLCRTIPEPARAGVGRKPVPLCDAVYSAVFKIYSGFSARRFSGELADAHERGYVGQAPHFNSVLKCLESEAVSPILLDLVRLSSLPLRSVETDFAVDSSGFCTSRFTRWFDVKYGITREQADWVKVHIATGVKTNVVTAIAIEDKNAADAPQFPGLVNTTAKGFTIHEFSADKAYAAADCFESVDAHGGKLFAAFKVNATGAVGGTFEKMLHYFILHREDYLTHYHKRSNVESTFSAVKRKFGDSVRSKTDTAMKNEVLAKFICQNLCCCIAAMYELGITPAFWKDEPAEEEPAVLRMNRPG